MLTHSGLITQRIGWSRRSVRVASVAVLGALLALVPAPAPAGLPQWTSDGPEPVGPVGAIAVDPTAPLTVYAGTSKAGGHDGAVYKSTNGGASWQLMNTNLPDTTVPALAIEPTSPSTVYAASDGVYKS